MRHSTANTPAARALQALIISAALSSCTVVVRGPSGIGPAIYDPVKAQQEILARSKEVASAIVAKNGVPSSNTLRAILDSHLSVANAMVQDWLTSKAAVKRQDRDSVVVAPNIMLVKSAEQSATAFADGTILVSAEFASGFDSYAAEKMSHPLLLAVLVHELIHIHDGHALQQWISADSRKAWIANVGLEWLSTLSILASSRLQFDFSHNSQSSLDSRFLVPLSEFAADVATVKILIQNGVDAGQYYAFLDSRASATRSSGEIEGPHEPLLSKRARCLNLLRATNLDTELSGIPTKRLNDEPGSVWEYWHVRQVHNYISNPVLPQKESGTPAAIRAIRESMFLACALAAAFPGLSQDNGVLSTPFSTFIINKHLAGQH